VLYKLCRGKRVIERRLKDMRKKLSKIALRLKNALGNVSKLYYYQFML
jgi:hypothetical protein